MVLTPSSEGRAAGASPESTTAAASPQQYLTSFASGVVYTAQARSSGIATLGPWSALASGPYLSAIAYTYDAIGRIESVVWAAGFTETYDFDSAGNLSSVVYTATP